MTFNKRIAAALLPATLLVLTACGHKEKATVMAPVRVKAICVQPTAGATSTSYSGTVEESAGVAVSFPVAGTVQRVVVSQGDRVSAGQLIAEVDASTLRNTHEMAAATLASATDTYNRMKQLHDANSLPDMQWVEVENALKSAQSAEAIARKGLNDARLYAPCSGYISEKYIEAGMNVAPGMPVVKIVDINPVKVNISLPENAVDGIRPGTTADITVGALGGERFSGKLVQKGVAANPLSRSYDAKFEVSNPQGKLLPGMVCDVTPHIAATGTPADSAIVVPVNAVLVDADNQPFVWLCNKGKAEKRTVTTRIFDNAGIVVSSGLQPGDSVIVEGLQKVSQSTPIVVLK